MGEPFCKKVPQTLTGANFVPILCPEGTKENSPVTHCREFVDQSSLWDSKIIMFFLTGDESPAYFQLFLRNNEPKTL